MDEAEHQRWRPSVPAVLRKAPTGIRGFDEITHGGIPHGRATLVTGSAGAGKTLFGLEFLVRGAEEYDEPGVLLALEESAGEIATNAATLGFDLPRLERERRLVVDAVSLDAATIVTTGSFDLDGLFLRLGAAIDAAAAKRVVLDSPEVLFTALGHEAIVRAELVRLLRWLKERGQTVLITGERGQEGSLTRFGIEEYVSDCVLVLDNRVEEGHSTRRMRVLKYRGSQHSADEYPFVVTDQGLVMLPLSGLGLSYRVSEDRISTGIPRLDHMLDGGVFRGSTVLVAGSAGTGKTSIAAHLVDAACARGERALFTSFEESPEQLKRNMRSIGLDFQRWEDAGLLRLHAARPTAHDQETHLVLLQKMLDETDPSVVVLDAVTGLTRIGSPQSTTAVVARQIDMLKLRGVTGVVTSLTAEPTSETSSLAISSLVDTWLLLRNIETGGERNRLLFVLKSRGSRHSNQLREFVLTDAGAQLLDVYAGPEAVLTGSARISRLVQEDRADSSRADRVRRLQEAHRRREAQVERKIAEIRGDLAEARTELDREVDAQASRTKEREAMAAHRWADSPSRQPDEGEGRTS